MPLFLADPHGDIANPHGAIVRLWIALLLVGHQQDVELWIGQARIFSSRAARARSIVAPIVQSCCSDIR